MRQPNAKRDSVLKLRKILYHYLSTESSMRSGATERQLWAAAKKIQQSGKLPEPVARALGLADAV